MSKFTTFLRLTPLAMAALLLTACATSVKPVDKNLPVPAGKMAVDVPEGTKPRAPHDQQGEAWWMLINIPSLNETIELALRDNTDVRLAQQRLNEAGAQLGLAKSDKWPAIFGQFSSTRNRPTQVGNFPVFGGRSIYETERIGISASWELDLWGRISALEGAAAANLMAQGYNLKGVRLSVSATAASLYTRQRVFDLTVRILESTLASRQAAYDLQKQRFEVGLTNELALRQVESELLSVQAQLPDAREQAAQNATALAVLVGGQVPSIPRLDIDGLYLSPYFIVPDETPSELLFRRPDLAAAEQQLAAAEGNLEAARKAFFPSISLTASGGRESALFQNLFTGPAKVWSFTTNLTQPIFQAGKLNNAADAAVAKRNQAVIGYEAAVRNAFREVYDATVLQREARERMQTRAAQVASLRQVVALAQKRVDAGVSPQLELLDAQRNLLGAELAWAQAWGLHQRALLAMITALGGGFDSRLPNPTKG